MLSWTKTKFNQYNNRTNRPQEIVKKKKKKKKKREIKEKVADWYQWRQKGILMFNTLLFPMFQGFIF